jgi:stearoyl-CoA desaturase (Delta-9 desaturase)
MLNQSQITIDNQRLQSLQSNFALGTIIIPFFGLIVAIKVLYHSGISRVEVLVTLISYFFTFIGVTVGFHRYFAHKAFQAHPFIRIALAILGSMAAQGPLSHWVATHRRHHQYSDLSEDPHSPYLHEGKKLHWLVGLWHSHLGWMMSSKITNSTLFAKDILKDPLLVKINQLYLVWLMVGLFLPSVSVGLWTMSWLGAIKGFLWGGLVRIFLVHHSFWYIGSLAHIIGQGDFETHDASRNNFWMAIPTFGESWHNNHHAFPNSASFSLHWWQFDLGGWVIRLLEKTGLVWDVRSPTLQMIEAKQKTFIKDET